MYAKLTATHFRLRAVLLRVHDTKKSRKKSRTKTMATPTQGGGRLDRPKNAMRIALATLTENAKQDRKALLNV